MAIIIEQQSKCPVCNTSLDKDKEYVLVPPLISNTKDDLFIFSDAGVHIECLNKNKLKNKLLQHINLYDEHMPPSKLRCIVDGKTVDNPKDLLFFGLLTSDEKEELYYFNYLSLNLKDINKWKDYNSFLSISEQFISEKKWEGLNDFNKIEYILGEMTGCC